MKRPIFIIIGTLIVLLLVGVWIYILFFNQSSSTPDETYADLGLGDTTDPSYTPPSTDDQTNTPVIDVTSNQALRQLTTRPVAGFQDVTATTSDPSYVYFTERGTGHIFSINLESGEEKRISATTIPLTTHSVITPNGRYTMVQSGSGNATQFTLGTISTTSDTLETQTISEPIVSFTKTIENTFLYAVKTNNSVVAKEFNPATKSVKNLFTVPFRETVIVWANSAKGVHFAYPKASAQLEGFIYQIKNGVLERLPIDGYGLSATGNASGILYSKVEKNEYKTYFYNQSTASSYPTLPALIPEKCSSLAEIICGGSYTTYKEIMPDTWYQGAASFADDLFITHPETNLTEPLTGVSKTTSQNIDISSLHISNDGQRIYFINTLDKNLWLFNQGE